MTLNRKIPSLASNQNLWQLINEKLKWPNKQIKNYSVSLAIRATENNISFLSKKFLLELDIILKASIPPEKRGHVCYSAGWAKTSGKLVYKIRSSNSISGNLPWEKFWVSHTNDSGTKRECSSRRLLKNQICFSFSSSFLPMLPSIQLFTAWEIQ